MFGIGRRTDYDLEKDLSLYKNDILLPDMYQYMPLISLTGFDKKVKKGIHMSHTVLSLWYAFSEETMEAFYFLLNTTDVKIECPDPMKAYTNENKDKRFDKLVCFMQNNKENIIGCFHKTTDGNWCSYYHDSLAEFMKHPMLKKGRVFVRPLSFYLSAPYTTIDTTKRNLSTDVEITMNGRITLEDRTGFKGEDMDADLFRLSFKDSMGQTFTTHLFLGVDDAGKYWDEEELRKKFNGKNQREEIMEFLRKNTYVPVTQFNKITAVMDNYLCENRTEQWEVVFEQVYVSGELGLTNEYYEKNK